MDNQWKEASTEVTWPLWQISICPLAVSIEPEANDVMTVFLKLATTRTGSSTSDESCWEHVQLWSTVKLLLLLFWQLFMKQTAIRPFHLVAAQLILKWIHLSSSCFSLSGLQGDAGAYPSLEARGTAVTSSWQGRVERPTIHTKIVHDAAEVEHGFVILLVG